LSIISHPKSILSFLVIILDIPGSRGEGGQGVEEGGFVGPKLVRIPSAVVEEGEGGHQGRYQEGVVVGEEAQRFPLFDVTKERLSISEVLKEER